METIKLFFKGIIIGIGKIIPGVSGSMLAISLGIYEKLLNSFSNIFKDFKESTKYLFKVGLGILFSVIFISRLIVYYLNNFYLPTMFLFIGLIIGGIPALIKVTKRELNKFNVLLLSLPFVFFFILDIVTKNYRISIELNYISVLLLGLLDAVTMIIPGISGTAVMMMLGVYENILNIFSTPVLNFLIIYILGILLGIVILSNIISYFLKKHSIKCYYI
ncbi:MAG TPA: DUF368 domain-containing protein, partial [Bacilli bacterium]|nr:DUF368 domain-containing protein [Bacilli bacterium]